MKRDVIAGCAVAALFISNVITAQVQPHHAWAPTPPMGWNSYDCFGATVTEQQLKDNAKMMSVHLKSAGWEYVVLDYAWYYPYPGFMNNPPQTKDFTPSLPMDKFGRLFPAPDRFPSSADGKGLKPLGDYIHSLGLKFGIHVMRGIPRQAVAEKLPIKGTKVTADQVADQNDTCRWLNTMYGVDMKKKGAQAYYNSIFNLYAEWGVDYVKVDDIASPYSASEVEAIRKAIDQCGRPMILSLSPGMRTPIEMADHMVEHTNMWRVSADFWDEWEDLKHMFELTHKWEKYIGSGAYPDADMIPIGLINIQGPNDGLPWRSRFTPEEQQTLMTLWAMVKSPLMYGGDLRSMRNSELKLLTNKEVLHVNQHSSGNRQLLREDDHVIWIANDPESGDTYIALFNIGEEVTRIDLDLQKAGLIGKVVLKDLWNGKTVGLYSGQLVQTLSPHASKLFRINVLDQ